MQTTTPPSTSLLIAAFKKALEPLIQILPHTMPSLEIRIIGRNEKIDVVAPLVKDGGEFVGFLIQPSFLLLPDDQRVTEVRKAITKSYFTPLMRAVSNSVKGFVDKPEIHSAIMSLFEAVASTSIGQLEDTLSDLLDQPTLEKDRPATRKALLLGMPITAKA